MTREEILNTALQLKSNNICLMLSTGVGKTKIALNILKDRFKEHLVYNILIVVPKNVLKEEWNKEIHKWDMADMIPHITFTTYVSLPKHNLTNYNAVVWDEAHHITDRCFDVIKAYDIKHFYSQINLFLSATLSNTKMFTIRNNFYNVYTLKVDIKDAVDNKILPDPEVLLIPLRFNKITPNQIYVKKKSGSKIVNCTFNDRWKWLKSKDKNLQVRIYCTEAEYFSLMEDDYNYAVTHCREWRKKQIAIERLKWTSKIKTNFVKSLLTIVSNERTITFCNGKKQCGELGSYPIYSGKKELRENLDKFNKGEIDHITSCAMLNEGANITSLRVGIFAYLTASDTPTFQKIGRILRHEKPIIIIPYYQGTREEEIVERMKDNFNPNKIHIINYLNEIKSYLK